MAQSKSSKRWLKEHFNDVYVKQAQAQGYRSRAAFKLIEIQEKDRLLKPGMTVIDLGAAPGGWSQVVAEHLHSTGYAIALDILPMDPITGVDYLQGDFREQEGYDALLSRIGDRTVDLVLSDIAPNASGISDVDQTRAMFMAELALDFAEHVLAKGGNFLVKVFQGEGFEPYLQTLRTRFEKVVSRKPKASRPRSRELYLLAKNFKLGK